MYGAAVTAVLPACDRSQTALPSAASQQVTRPPSAFALPDLILPTSTATGPPPGEALVVVLSPRRLAVGAEGRTLAVPPADAAQYGFAITDKSGSSRGSFDVVPSRNLVCFLYGSRPGRTCC